MLRRLLLTAALAAATCLPLRAQDDTTSRALDQIRSALGRLPYYGVFDFLAFQYDRGVVTVSGYAYRPTLKREAADAVSRVPHVDEVLDRIEELPVSPHDDRIRWATFYRIYNDDFLSRYAPGGTILRFDRRFDMARYPGMQPFGTYPIHIIVKGGRTLLLGTVDSTGDRTRVELRAREVPGTFAVVNELIVAR